MKPIRLLFLLIVEFLKIINSLYNILYNIYIYIYIYIQYIYSEYKLSNILYKEFIIFKDFTMRRNNNLIGFMFICFLFNFSILLFFHFKEETLYDSFA